jgi:hypothetical protein
LEAENVYPDNEKINALKEAVSSPRNTIEVVKMIMKEYKTILTRYYVSLLDILDTAMSMKKTATTRILCEELGWNFSVGWMGARRISSTSPEIVDMMWNYVSTSDYSLNNTLYHLVGDDNLEMVRHWLTKTKRNYYASPYVRSAKMRELLLDFGEEITNNDIYYAVNSDNTEMIALITRVCSTDSLEYMKSCLKKKEHRLLQKAKKERRTAKS